MDLPKIGISACLLGKDVRYNAGHKLDRYLKNILGQYVEYITVCPEVEAGFGVPREPVQLNDSGSGIKMITVKSQKDLSDDINEWIYLKLDKLEKEDLCGFILKSKSPSCGVFKTKIYRGNRAPLFNGRGLFASALMNRFPNLLVEEESGLYNSETRETFIQNIFIIFRWKKIYANRTVKELLEFHNRMTLTLMLYNYKINKELNHIIAHSKEKTIEADYIKYYLNLCSIFKESVTLEKNKLVMEHTIGYLKKDLTKDEKSELMAQINNYANSTVPRIVPLTLINHYAGKYNNEFLQKQFYLNPTSMELMLRNHV